MYGCMQYGRQSTSNPRRVAAVAGRLSRAFFAALLPCYLTPFLSMGKKKNPYAMPKLAPTAAASSLLQTKPGSGAVSLGPSALPAVPSVAPRLQPASFAPAEPVAKQSRGDKIRERAATAGANWGHMRAPTMTQELKRDLLVVKMRGVLDPKRFYRASDNKTLPKYFQMGTVVEGAEDGAAHRLTRKERKGSMLEEILGDRTVRKRAKTQFEKSQAEHSSGRKRTVNRKGPAKKGL